MLAFVFVKSSSVDIFHDTVFQLLVNASVAIIAAFLTSFVSFWIYSRQRNKREISYRIVSNANIATIDKNLESRVEIKLDGNTIKNARLIVLDIWNSGNTAIKSDDYNEPIIFVFDGAKVIGNEVLFTEPADLININTIKNSLISHTESVEISSFLLNPKQRMRFSVLIDSEMNIIKVKGRLINGNIRNSEFEFRSVLTKSNKVLMLQISVLAFIYLSLLMFIWFTSQDFLVFVNRTLVTAIRHFPYFLYIGAFGLILLSMAVLAIRSENFLLLLKESKKDKIK